MRVGPAARPADVLPAVPGRQGVVGGARRTALALLLAGTAAVGLTACGGGSDDGESTVAPDAGVVGAATTATAPAGPDAEQARAGAVVTQYVAAFSAGDGDRVCRLYTPAQRRRIADAAGGTCAGGIRTAYAQGGGEDGFSRSLGNLRVGSTTVRGDTAIVRLVAAQAGGSGRPFEVQLQKRGDAWRISRPGGGG